MKNSITWTSSTCRTAERRPDAERFEAQAGGGLRAPMPQQWRFTRERPFSVRPSQRYADIDWYTLA